MADGGSPCEVSAAYVRACTADFNAWRTLGKPGAFGVVYRGVDAALNVRFAVKRLSNTAPWPAERSAAREIEILSRFRHPNIIRLWGFTTDPAERCLVYELGEEGALSDNLTDGARAASLTWPVRCRIAAGVAAALNYLHRSGATPAWHRDIKAENVVLTASLEPKLIDCGISKLLTEKEAARGVVTATGALAFGTPGYMCPTYARRHKYDEAAEVYSFGVLLCELFTGMLQLGDAFAPLDLVDDAVESEWGLEAFRDMRPPPWRNDAALHELVVLASMCVLRKPHQRPQFAAVHRRLNALRVAHCVEPVDAEFHAAALAAVRSERDALLQRQEAAAAQQRGPLRECRIFTACPERPLFLSDGLECAHGHFVCAGCMAAAVDSRSAAAPRLGCLCCGGGPFSDRALVLCLPESAGLKYLSQVQKDAEAAAARQLETEFEGRVAVAVERRLAEDALAPLRRRIIDDVLTLQCPACRKAMADEVVGGVRRQLPWEGCFAVECRDDGGHGCGAHFCGWCFAVFPVGRAGSAACHAHVGQCAHNAAPRRDLFGGANAVALFTESLRALRQRKLQAHLAGLPEAQRAALLASLQRELHDAGLQAERRSCGFWG